MVSVNQIPGFLNQPFLQNILMKQPHFLRVYTNSEKVKADRKLFVERDQKTSVANLVSGLSNWLYLKNEDIELADFFRAGTNSCSLKGA